MSDSMTRETTNVGLDVVEATMREAIDAQIRKPQLTDEELERITQKSQRSVAGFKITDPQIKTRLEDEAREELKKRWSHYESTRESMTQKLKQMGINPRSVLPGKVWNRLYKTAGLYQLRVYEDDCIRLETEELKQKIGIKEREYIAQILVLYAILIVSVGIGAGYLSYLHEGILVGSIIVGILSSFSAFIVAVMTFMDESPIPDFLEGMMSRVQGVWMKRRARKFAEQTSWQDFLRIVMPEQRSYSGFYSNNIAKVKVILPEPPADVSEILARVEDGIDLKVAVDPECFGIEGGIRGVVDAELKKSKEEQERHFDLGRDPIVLWEMNGVVAVIAQFGDSPFERRVINVIANEHDLL